MVARGVDLKSHTRAVVVIDLAKKMRQPYRVVAAAIVEEARRRIPESLLKAGGRALYSPAITLAGRSPIYFLGVNPREISDITELHSRITINEDLTRLENDAIVEHAYLDERWKTFDVGKAPIQVRGQTLFAILSGGSLEDGCLLLKQTPVSNFVLYRSIDVQDLERKSGIRASELALDYWPFHEALIRETGCSVILTHAIGFAKELVRAKQWGTPERRSSGWGGTLDSLYAWELPNNVRLLAIPNLSRYDPSKQRSEHLHRFFQEFAI